MAQTPPALHDALEVARAALYARSTHALSAAVRAPIYAALNVDGEDVGHRARTWLAILAARNALFRASLGAPDRNVLPEREIELATEIAKGCLKADAPDVRAHLESGFTALIAPWLADPTFAAAFTLRVNAAFRTAHLALCEAAGAVQAVEHLAENHIRLPGGSWPAGADSSSDDSEYIDATDPAFLASVATSWNEERGASNATALLRFWDNWLIETVPGAWDAAHVAWESSGSRATVARSQLSFYFDWGADSCLWTTTDAFMGVFCTLEDPERLPLSPTTAAQICHMATWYQGFLNWDYPPDPGPWRQEECDRFNRDSAILLEAIRRELAEEFEVVGDPYELREDPRLDEYLRDPKAYHHLRGISD